MQKNKKETSEPIATLRLQAKAGRGRIELPKGKRILLDKELSANGLFEENIQLHDGSTLRIGRGGSNDLVLAIPNVSRFHALIVASSSGLILNDLRSTNGSFLNGGRVTAPVEVATEDIIEIGPAKLVCDLYAAPINLTTLQTAGTELDSMMMSGIVTVLVADVCQYTRLSEALPQADVARMLQVWLDRVSKIIKKFGGEVDKYIGDCVMALWRGTKLNASFMAHEALKAAIEIRKMTAQLSASPQWQHRKKFPWQCRVALNTGQVMIGVLGVRGSREFTVLGDVVNVAFRLNSLGSECGRDLLTGEATAKHVQGHFDLKKLGALAVKGRSEKVTVYTLA